MKKVIVHCVEVRTLEVPDECPTDDVDEFEKWVYNNILSMHSHPYENPKIAVKIETRDFEIVDVEAIVPENEKVGSREDIHQR